MNSRSSILVVAAGMVLLSSVSAIAQMTPPSRLGFPVTLSGSGPIEFSKPAVANLDNDASAKEIVVGTRGGQLYVINANGSVRAGWPKNLGCEIASSPSVGDIDGDGFGDIAVGCGSASDLGNPGGVWAFRRDGTQIWKIFPFTPQLNGHVFSTPAIGDVDGDGQNEVVFGAWDFYVYVVRRDGSNQPGWPVHVRDTVWSSPALFDLDGDGKLEVIVGSDTHFDAPPINTQNGGTLWVFRANGTNFPGFPQRITPLGIHSSPAVGDIDGDGSPEIVVGGGPFSGAGGRQVYAYRCNGTALPGWPVSVDGQTFNSPALANLDADPALEVVVADDAPFLYAFNGDGSQIFKMRPKTSAGVDAVALSEPIIAQITASATPDIAVGNVEFEVAVVSATGVQLSDNGTNGGIRFRTTRPVFGAVASDLEGDGTLDFIAASGTFDGVSGTVSVWNPGPVGAMPWPAFRQDAALRQGVAPGTAVCAPQPPSATRFHTLTPCRIVDTRLDGGAWSGPALSAGETRTFLIHGQCGVPTTAKAVAFNVTITGATVFGDLRLYPGYETLPPTSTINFRAGQTRANNAILPLASNGGGQLSVSNAQPAGTVHLILDVFGYFD